MHKFQATLWTQLAFIQAESLSIDFYVYTMWVKKKSYAFLEALYLKYLSRFVCLICQFVLAIATNKNLIMET